MLPRYFCRSGQSHIPPRCPSRDLGLTPASSRLLVGLDRRETRNPCPGNAVPRPWGTVGSRPHSRCSVCARSHRRERGNLGELPVPTAAPSGSSADHPRGTLWAARPGLRARPRRLRGQQGHIPAWIGQGIVPQDGSCCGGGGAVPIHSHQ